MEKFINIFKSLVAIMAPQLKKTDSVHDVKNIKEAIVGVNEISLFMCEKLKDGVQFTDAVDFYNKITLDEDFKSKIIAAYEGHEKIKDEAKDIDAGEALELLGVQVEYVPKFIECFQK